MKVTWQILTVICLTFAVEINTEEDYDNLPYEFGFTIDGQQHRHEKKDVNGIIQGEFGFITADGVYHVTVYATDENGNFRILSMKNIKISPPLDGSGEPGQAKGLAAQRKSNLPVAAPTTTTAKPFNGFTTQSTIKPACGGCGYVTTPKTPPGEKPKFPFQTPAFKNDVGAAVVASPPANPLGVNQEEEVGVQQNVGYQGGVERTNLGVRAGYGQEVGQQQGPVAVQDQQDYQNQGGFGQQPVQYPAQQGYYDDGQVAPGGPQVPQGYDTGLAALPPSEQAVEPPSSKLSKVTVSDGVIHVPGNPDIPIQDKYPNMQEGLPAGIEENDIVDLLYKFNYTVGFHGHYEKGYKNGAKVGGYFVNGRDGVSRVVTYVADENGYRPKFKFIRLGLDSPDTPKEGTEKKFGLKNFEFVWYPVN